MGPIETYDTLSTEPHPPKATTKGNGNIRCLTFTHFCCGIMFLDRVMGSASMLPESVVGDGKVLADDHELLEWLDR